MNRSTKRPEMTQEMLPVFCAHINHRLTISGGERPLRQVTHIGEEISPLRCQEMDQVQPLCLPFQNRARGGKEMHMRFGAPPAFGLQTVNARHLEAQFPLP